VEFDSQAVPRFHSVAGFGTLLEEVEMDTALMTASPIARLLVSCDETRLKSEDTWLAAPGMKYVKDMSVVLPGCVSKSSATQAMFCCAVL